ncbi:folate-binding protein YgfZ [Halovulum dunhuangense]|uniref:Folate-binding protein YgfZ n=1 Tax=Halovulum dunhuangense TaxID=1505036 RepID=A0A849L4J1_9RHOB|nr:folate-binding protein YgfZ [Halovulum dunhuangense]NNU81348.1 folate-binding protein YgfZ [Halovulum dunhuangense]
MIEAFHATDRAVLRVAGPDHRKFLQDLVTNDIRQLSRGAVYAALLTPQGKYLADFLIVPGGDESVLLDCDAAQAQDLARRLSMYRLRAKVTIEETALRVVQLWGEGTPPEGAIADPRDASLGWRLYGPDPQALMAGLAPGDPVAWDALRIERGVPASGRDLVANDSYILESGFDRLNGVDFRKGCYVGQEVTARMRHKTELRKGLVRVRVEGAAPPPGTEILRDGKRVGTLHSTANGIGLAHLRFDRMGEGMAAGDARIHPIGD